MKLFKLSSIVALFFALAAQSAFAEEGKMPAGDVKKGALLCMGHQTKADSSQARAAEADGQGAGSQGSSAANAQ